VRGAPTSFWGKLEQDEAGAVLAWHPLEDHCADVAACAEQLLNLPVLRSSLARLGGLPDLTDIQIARLAALAALHDVGKFNLTLAIKKQSVLAPRFAPRLWSSGQTTSSPLSGFSWHPSAITASLFPWSPPRAQACGSPAGG
jgi:hypothetical protein